MSDDLVERVARAMWMADPEPYDPSDRRPFEEADWEAQRNYRAEARAACLAMLEAWPGMHSGPSPADARRKSIILPLTENTNEE